MILFSLEPKTVTEAESYVFAESACHECENYYILGGDKFYTDIRKTKPIDRKVIEITLLDDTNLFKETKRGSRKKRIIFRIKSRGFLCRSALLRGYAAKEKADEFLTVFCSSKPQMAEIVFKKKWDIVRCVTTRKNEVFTCLKELDIDFDSFRETKRLVSLYSDFHNTAEMPCNC